ncbi:MAG: DUF1987 domain-containing protein [Candidatus Cloacimonas sp.]|jgi:dihydroxyacetone kinase-like predicted kinase|nr:DUF1987 domain-containing protein [Candidatus Cloacimonas sp.]
MDNYIVPQTKHTPQIELHYSDKYLRIAGDSYPENAMEVFQPLIERLESYFAKAQQSLTIDVLVDYQNTSSTKMMTDIIAKLQHFHETEHQIKLTWYYPEGDIDCLENCEMLLEDASFPYAITELKD